MRPAKPVIAKNIFLLLVLGVFLVICFLMQSSHFMSGLVANLQVNHVPSELLSYNKLGELFKKLGLLKTIPNNSTRYPQEYNKSSSEEIGPFQKRRQIGSALLTPGKEHSLMAEVKKSLEDVKRVDDNLYISVKTEKDNIYGDHGILTHSNKHGKAWEKLSYVAMFKGAQMIANTAAGIRLHGGKSRAPSMEKHNFRLYFRKKYGERQIDVTDIFPTTESVRTMVVHYDSPDDWPLNNAIANDLYRMVGVQTVDYVPVKFYLNDKDYGLYWISPHLSRKYILQHYKIQKIHYQRFKGQETNNVYRKDLGEIVYDYEKKLSVEDVGGVVDINGMVNYFIALTYSGNTDWNQGVAFKDRQDENSLWQWIAWDLDHSFIDWYKSEKSQENKAIWQQSGLDLVLKEKISRIRSRRQLMLRRLLLEDPGFKDSFIKRYTHVLNHELSLDKLKRLYGRYKDVLTTYQKSINPLLSDFFENRHGFIRQDIQYYFNVSAFNEVIIETSKDTELLVDNTLETSPYRGFYPEGMEITVRPLLGEKESGYWLLNNEIIRTEELSFKVSEKTDLKFIKL